MKQLLHRSIPLMTLLCSVLGQITPLNGMANTANSYYYYQQSAVPLKTVLNQISSYYKVTLLYDESLIQGKTTNYKFVANASNSIEKTMQDVLTTTNLKMQKVDNDNYVLIAATSKKTSTQTDVNATDVPALQQQATLPVNVAAAEISVKSTNEKIISNVLIKGRIVNAQKEEPIASAVISVKETSLVTSSDAEGYFTLKIPNGIKSVTVSHISFTALDFPVDSRNSMIIRLVAKEKNLENVVVLGLYKRPKENFTGAATTVSGDQIRQVNSVNALDALKVFDPSIRIPDNMIFGSDPNRLPIITLRGTNNFPQQGSSSVPTSGADFMANYGSNPNQPLFILDGYEVSLQKVYDLDMTRIANFTVLKDAAATSIYGSRAANGVIVVDTKQPESGKLRINYSGMAQITGPDLTVYNLTNAADKLEIERLAGLYSTYATGIRPDADAILKENYSSRMAAVQRGVNTYWLSQPIRTGLGQRHSLYLEGGDLHFRYGIDLGFNKVAGVMKNSDRNVYSGAMNFSYRNKGLLFKNVLSVTFNNVSNSNFGSFGEYSKQNQYWNPLDSLGNYAKILETVRSPLGNGNTTYYNPLYNTTLNTVNTTAYSNVINQTSVEWNVANGFRITGKMGLTKQSDESDLFLPSQHTSFLNVSDITKKGSYTKGNGKFFSYDGSLHLEYSKKIGKHQIFNTTGASIAETKSDAVSVYVEGFPNQRLNEIVFGNAYPANTKPSGSSSVSRRVSGFTNFNYSYDGKYQADLSISVDGSSQFGINNRFAPFWSFGSSWNMHKESFIKSLKNINQFRIRGSMGTTGDSRFPPYMGITTYQYYTDQNLRGQLGAIILGYGNPNLQWQQTFKKNIGVDLSLFKNRLNLTFDYYQENTKSLILDISTPPSVGFNSYRENIGELENKGYEMKLNAFLIKNDRTNMNWTVFVNGSHNDNKIKSISNTLKKQNEQNDKNDQTKPQLKYQEGQSVNAIWAVRSLGIDPSNGREVYLNRFDSLTYVWSALDKVIIGDALAKLRGNFGTSFNWKGFGVSLFFSYELGGHQYNQTLSDRVEDANLSYNVDQRVLLGRWTTPGSATYFKGLVDENGRTVSNKTNATSRFFQKNNYINSESMSFSYMFSNKLNKYLRLNNSRISLTVNDIARWSSIEIERGTEYPFARNFTFNFSTQF